MEKTQRAAEEIAKIQRKRNELKTKAGYPHSAPQKIAVRKARNELKEYNEAMDAATSPLSWSLEDWKEFFRSTPMDTYRVTKEIVTHKKQKELQQNLKEAEKKDNTARKLFSLTGHLPGEKSGVVKVDAKAQKEIEEHLHKVKIYVSRLLAYGKDDNLKKEIMKEVKGKYPELIPEIKQLATKAKERAKTGVMTMVANQGKSK